MKVEKILENVSMKIVDNKLEELKSFDRLSHWKNSVSENLG